MARRKGWRMGLALLLCFLTGCQAGRFSGFEGAVYFCYPDRDVAPGGAVYRVGPDGEGAERLPLHTGVDDCLQAGEALYFTTHNYDTDISPIPYMLVELYRYAEGHETLLAKTVVGTIQIDGGRLYYLQYRGEADTLWLCCYDLATGEQHLLFEAPIGSFLADGDRIYTVEQEDTEGMTALRLYDLAEEASRLLVEGTGTLQLEAALSEGLVYSDGDARWYLPLEAGGAVALPYQGLLLPGEGAEGYLLTPDGWVERVPIDRPDEGERLVEAVRYTDEGGSISSFYLLEGWLCFSTDTGPTYRYNLDTGVVERCPDAVRGLPVRRAA